MILLSLAMFGFAVADLLRWSPGPVSRGRALGSAAAATAMTVVLARLSGMPWLEVSIGGVGTLIVLALWLLSDSMPLGRRPGYPLAFIGVVLIIAFGASGSQDAVTGPLATWYGKLPFPFARSVSADQFLLAVAAALFLLATGNRIVRLVLDAAGTPAITGETTLRGGRLLGPMERLFVAALVVAGEPAGAAVVIAAKGLLRLPEIRESSQQLQGKDDLVTEYFLVGTFSSLLLGVGLAGIILAAS